MTSRTPRSTAPARSDLLSLAALSDLIAADETLPPHRRRDMRSALATFATALGEPSERLRAEPRTLRVRLDGITPAMVDLSPSRWANVKSLVRAALTYVGTSTMPARQSAPFTPDWQAFMDRLPDAYIRRGLSRFARFCGASGISPDGVSDEVLDLYKTVLEREAMTGSPRQLHRQTCQVWNRAMNSAPTGPGALVAVPDYTDSYALPWERFPPSLLADVNAYLDHLAGTDPLAEIDFRPLKASSIATRRRQLHELVSAMVHGGCDPATLRGIADVTDVDRIKLALRFLLGRSERRRGEAGQGKPTVHMRQLVGVVTAAARHWLKVEHDHLERLRRLRQRLGTGQTGLSDKNIACLTQLKDPAKLKALVRLPVTIMQEAERKRSVDKALAREVQTAVAVEILLMTSIRLGNLVSIRIGTHLHRRAGAMHLRFVGAEVKNGTEIERVLTAESARLIGTYIDKYLPLLETEPSGYLFPGMTGGAKSPDMLRDQISSCVKERVGVTVTPHQFRHIGGMHYLAAHPGAYGVVRLVNGHKSIATTMKFYCGSETDTAVAHFDAHVLALRSDEVVRPDGRIAAGAERRR